MSEEELEAIMIANYRNTFKDLLFAAFRSDPTLAPEFLAEPIKRQREIEQQAASTAQGMAESLVSKLKSKGFLAKDPSDAELRALIRSTLEEFGVEQE